MTNDKAFSNGVPRGDVVLIGGARFRVDGVIRQGANSRILSAHSMEGGGDSAFVIKYTPCRRDDERWDACLREIHAGRLLRRCRGILPLLGYAVRTDGAGNDGVFLLFERAECLEGARLLEREVTAMARSVIAALRCMSRKGLAHGDVKPANLYRMDGRWLLGDLGSVTEAGQPARFVSEGYCAPEALRGGPCGFRADLYSLGISCYRLLSGTLPFCPLPCAEMTEDEVHEAIGRRLSGEPIPPVPGVSDSVNRAILRMCEFSPRKRKG